VPYPTPSTPVLTVGEKTNTATTGTQKKFVPEAPTIEDFDHDTASTPKSLGKDHTNSTDGSAIYGHSRYSPAVSKTLQPFFFMSVVFSIPIARMFNSVVV
jgi:hypothetical protein